MDNKALKRFEYEEQMFHFSSQFFADCFKNFVANELKVAVEVLVNSFKNKLLEHSKNREEFSKKVEEMKDRLKAEYMKNLEKEFTNIKGKISKSMEIPEHVLLEEDLPVKSGSSLDISEIKKEINFLNDKYKAMCYMKKKLQKEIDKADYTTFTLLSITEPDKVEFKIFDTTDIFAYRKSNLGLLK